MSSCGDLGHFPQLVLQNNEPVSWWLEQICQAHGGSEVKPPDSSHEEHKSLASPIVPEGRICILHEGQCSRSLGTHEKWSFKKAESAGLWILTSLIFSCKIIHVSAGTKSLQMYLGEVLQASNEFQLQNFRYCEAQTADKGAGRLWIVLPKSSDLSDTWSFSCKKESNVYLRVARHAWVMFLLFFLIFTTFFTTAFLNVQEKFLASVPLIVKPHWRVKYILVKVCNCNCLLWFLGRQTLLVLVKV